MKREEGFLMIEVIVGAFCLALLVAAIATLFVTGNRGSLAAQRQSAMLAVADQQIETIRDKLKANGNFSALAMSALPSSGSSATLSYDSNTHTDPNYFVTSKSTCGSGAELAIETNYDDSSQGTATGGEAPFTGCDSGYEPLITATGGIVTPSQTVSVGTETATVDSYVTETFVGCNTLLQPGVGCTNDARRVTVAVAFNNSSGRSDTAPNSPIYVSTIFTNPVPSNAPNSSIGITLGLTIG
jgi:type II secretory pathway pseudopilin PulG